MRFSAKSHQRAIAYRQASIRRRTEMRRIAENPVLVAAYARIRARLIAEGKDESTAEREAMLAAYYGGSK